MAVSLSHLFIDELTELGIRRIATKSEREFSTGKLVNRFCDLLHRFTLIDQRQTYRTPLGQFQSQSAADAARRSGNHRNGSFDVHVLPFV